MSHLNGVHSGTYLEQLSGCACQEPREREEAAGLGSTRAWQTGQEEGSEESPSARATRQADLPLTYPHTLTHTLLEGSEERRRTDQINRKQERKGEGHTR
ncbi:hypothetical protein EYF80_009242 [Liparis tanakae]|uniref:Uncharacterized protein n=1 Tax=Liparis tanakae TaxID=230148 RepID=A0A4Z2ITI2_9TELE|nr:hypothetical protein EYF80_009242 [Liparis tanakae]